MIWANLIPNEPAPLLRVAYFRSATQNCARPGQQKLTLNGRDIHVSLTLMRLPDTPWAPPHKTTRCGWYRDCLREAGAPGSTAIRRNVPHQLEVVITHHEIADPSAVCTADFPILETDVPLGSEFNSGVEYTVNVNEDASVTFAA